VTSEQGKRLPERNNVLFEERFPARWERAPVRIQRIAL
jgi:hypothetical protein